MPAKRIADERAKLVPLFAEAAAERGLPQLKVYAPDGEALFSTDPAEIGQAREERGADRGDRAKASARCSPHEEPDGTRYNEFYVPLQEARRRGRARHGALLAAGDLRAILARSLVLPVLVPGLLLLGLLVVLGFLISRAQAGIDLRAARVRELSARLESFMSSSAVGAVRARRTAAKCR